MKTLCTYDLRQPVPLSDFMGSLQMAIPRSFNEVSFFLNGAEVQIYAADYLPSLDGFLNNCAEVSVEGLSFSNERKPKRIEHLLATIRVVLHSGFDGLLIRTMESGRLFIYPRW